jgi:RND family efflux transporter MFP subunit
MNIIIRTIVSLTIIAAFFLVGKVLIAGKPEERSKKPAVVIPRVDTVSVPLGNYRPAITSYGTVQSYFETQLTPVVNGKITSVSPKFRVGEMVKEGEILATIDAADYQAALATQKATLTLQKSALAEEEIRAEQAAEDWKASGRELSSASDFVLRKPQLAAARANIDAAQTAIDQAEVDLTRTKIKAPYDAVVTSRNASLGNYATAQNSLGTLIATEKAEVRIPLTAEQMKRIQFSENEPPQLTLTNPSKPNLKWTAKLTRMEPTLDPQNQVSYGIATMDNPYTNEVAPLPVGSFVNVSIPATEITDAYQVPESALVNDSFVWLVDKENKLVRAEAARIQSDATSAYVRIKLEGLEPPLNVVSRPLSNFHIGTVVESNQQSAK